MPYKDTEARKAYHREQMRRRRETVKSMQGEALGGAQPLASLPSQAPAVASSLAHTMPEPGIKPPVSENPYSLTGRIYYKDAYLQQAVLNPFTMANHIRRNCFNDGGYCLAYVIRNDKPGLGDEQIVFHFPDCPSFPQDIADFVLDKDWSVEDIRNLLFGLMSPTGDPKDYQRTGPVGSIKKED